MSTAIFFQRSTCGWGCGVLPVSHAFLTMANFGQKRADTTLDGPLQRVGSAGSSIWDGAVAGACAAVPLTNFPVVSIRVGHDDRRSGLLYEFLAKVVGVGACQPQDTVGK